MRLQQISEIIHQLCFGQLMDLLIEILADAPYGTRIGIYRLGLETFEGLKEVNTFFADLGLFTMSEAHKLARQSRWGNNWLESPSRENYTPGSEVGDGESRSLPLFNQRFKCDITFYIVGADWIWYMMRTLVWYNWLNARLSCYFNLLILISLICSVDFVMY